MKYNMTKMLPEFKINPGLSWTTDIISRYQLRWGVASGFKINPGFSWSTEITSRYAVRCAVASGPQDKPRFILNHGNHFKLWNTLSSCFQDSSNPRFSSHHENHFKIWNAMSSCFRGSRSIQVYIEVGSRGEACIHISTYVHLVCAYLHVLLVVWWYIPREDLCKGPYAYKCQAQYTI